jgi:mono/diheme cytochrome c family protein
MGKSDIFPALVASPVVQASDPVTLISIVLNGGKSVGTDAAPTASEMPHFRGLLDDQQVADVLTYVRNSWGNAAPAVTADQVTNLH